MRRLRKRWVILIACIAVLTYCLATSRTIARFIEGGPAGIHQESVKRSLAEWGHEHGTVQNWHEAKRAIDMLEYVQHYYVPGPGYRSSARIEAELEAQRAQTVEAIVNGLQEFTGQAFGPEPDKWREWLRQQGRMK